MDDEDIITLFGSVANCKVEGVMPRIRGLLNICPPFTRVKGDPRYNSDIKDRIGSMATDQLLTQTFIMKSDLESKALNAFNLEDISHVPSIIHEFLFTYLNCIWFQFDNCFMLRRIFVHSSSGKLAFNEPPGLMTTSDGLFAVKVLTAEVMRQAELDFEIVSQWDAPKKRDQEPRPQIGNFTFIPVRDKFYSYNKLTRTYLLLTQARLSQLIPMKLTFYVIALECLFSNDDQSEVNHKVSERAAIFLSENSDERIQLYRKFKELYGVRS